MAALPTPAYLAESRQADLYAAVIATWLGALIVVTLRFWSRKLKAAHYGLDDWLISAAMVGSTAMLANYCWWIPRAFGKHREAFGPNVDHDFLLAFFIAQFIYNFIITCVKYSILALYWRIFGGKTIGLPVWILTAIVTAWFIAVTFLDIFACIPPKAFWDKTIKNAHCGVDNRKLNWGVSVPNIVTDITLLVLPILYIMRLKISRIQKRLLVGTFTLGGFVCVASIVRLVMVLTQKLGPDIPWDLVNQGIWAVIEINFAIICACLPTLRPIWVKVFKPTISQLSSSGNSRRPGLWTIGTGSSQRSRQKVMDSSILDATITPSTHPFHAIPEGNDSAGESSKTPPNRSAGHIAQGDDFQFEMHNLQR